MIHRAFVFLAFGALVGACSTMSALAPVEPPPPSSFDSAGVSIVSWTAYLFSACLWFVYGIQKWRLKGLYVEQH